MTVAIGSDHAGFALKQAVRAELATAGHDVLAMPVDGEVVARWMG